MCIGDAWDSKSGWQDGRLRRIHLAMVAPPGVRFVKLIEVVVQLVKRTLQAPEFLASNPIFFESTALPLFLANDLSTYKTLSLSD